MKRYRSYIGIVLTAIACCGFALAPAHAAPVQCTAVFSLVNQARSNASVPPLKSSNVLNEAAAIRAREIVREFSHNRPDGSLFFTVLDKHSFNFGPQGENIASGHSTGADVMNAWMNSTGHRDNILDTSYNRIGIGAYSHNGRMYWVQIFAGDAPDASGSGDAFNPVIDESEVIGGVVGNASGDGGGGCNSGLGALALAICFIPLIRRKQIVK